MRRTARAAGLAGLMVCAVAAAQPPADPPKEKAAQPDGPPEFEVTFTDGSKVRMVVLEPAIAVATRYGKLTVPFAEVRRVDLGFRYPEGVEAKVEAAVAGLGSESFRAREDAEKALLAFGEYAVPSLKRAVVNPDPEVARRAEAVLKKLADKLPEARMNARDYDSVKTAEFSMRGRIETPTVRVRTKQFGELAMKIGEVRSIRSLFGGAASAELTLDSAKYARQGWPAWMDTGIDVSTDARLEITCTGKIDQWIQTPGQYMSGPDGTGAMAPGGPAMVPPRLPGLAQGFGPGGGMGGPAPGVGGWKSGSVVGRVGQKGNPFAVGSSYKQSKAPGTGRLYLIIAPSNWNNDSAGSYKVKVRVGD
jgi:hypothetical protein